MGLRVPNPLHRTLLQGWVPDQVLIRPFRLKAYYLPKSIVFYDQCGQGVAILKRRHLCCCAPSLGTLTFPLLGLVTHGVLTPTQQSGEGRGKQGRGDVLNQVTPKPVDSAEGEEPLEGIGIFPSSREPTSLAWSIHKNMVARLPKWKLSHG